MELFALLLGACCLVPLAALATYGLARARRSGHLANWVYWTLIGVIWIPIGLAAIAEAWYLLVEEPRRIEQGLPID